MDSTKQQTAVHGLSLGVSGEMEICFTEVQTFLMLAPQPVQSKTSKGVYFIPGGFDQFGRCWHTNVRVSETFDRQSQLTRRHEELIQPAEWLNAFCEIQRGDRLWLREGFRIFELLNGTKAVQYLIDHNLEIDEFAVPGDQACACEFLKLHADRFEDGNYVNDPDPMPRWASRWEFIVHEVRAKRLRDVVDPNAITLFPTAQSHDPEHNALARAERQFSRLQQGKSLTRESNLWVFELRVEAARLDRELKFRAFDEGDY